MSSRILDRLRGPTRSALEEEAEQAGCTPEQLAVRLLEERIGKVPAARTAPGEFVGAREDGDVPTEITRGLGDQTLVGLYLIQDGTFQYVNDRLAELLGYEPEEVIGRLGPRDLTHPDDWPEAERKLRRRLDGEVSSLQYDLRVVGRDGEVHHVAVLGTRIEYRGEPAVVGTLVDVTERERYLRELEENRDLLRRSQRVAQIGGWEYDPAADTARGTEQLYRILGLPEGEGFSLETGLDFYASEARPEVAEAMKKCMDEGTSFDREVPLVRTDGERRWVRVRGRAELEDEEVRRVTGTLQDVTPRREVERKLQISRSRIQRLIEHSPQIVFILDEEGTILVSEGRDLHILDVEPGEHVGRSVYEIYAEHPQVLEKVDRALAGEAVDADVEIGDAILDVWYAPYYDENDEVAGCLGMAADVTARRERQRQLEASKREAEEASDMKSALLENMSHEVRTPLSSIIGFAELMEEQLGPKYARWAHSIRANGERLHDTLEEVLNLAQLEGGEFSLQYEPTDLVELVEEAVRLMEPNAQRQSLTLRTSYGGLDDPVVRCCPQAVETILGRLLHNAVKFTEEGGVDVRVGRHDGSIAITVEDTGIGIPEEIKERVYEPFFQASQGWSREYEGAGLGLTVIQHLVDRLGGATEIESGDERGTRVTVRLPIRSVRREEAPTGAEPAPRSTADAGETEPVHVLVVEDDEGMRALVREMLRGAERVDEAADPESALDRARSATYDTVLLDVNLRSDRSGTDLIVPIRSAQNGERATCFVAMTAYAMPGDRERFLEAGFDDYLAKPFTREVLWRAIRHSA